MAYDIMSILRSYLILSILGSLILYPTISKAQFNEDQVAKQYAVLRDSLDRADSLLASGDDASALAITKPLRLGNAIHTGRMH